MKKVFIDGEQGTTGLKLKQRLIRRTDVALISLPESLRKDPDARRAALEEADAAFLCLPDEAAKQAVLLAEPFDTAIIDASTAHRTDPRFVYGFPEVGGRRQRIANAKRIANPGCHASGFIALIAPLTETGVLKPDARLTCWSLTGYSGGGKKMIAQYEETDRDPLLGAPRLYALTQSHKHLPEMKAVCGLENAPLFCPVVADYFSGMQTNVPLFAADLKAGVNELKEIYRAYYRTGLVRFAENADEGGFLSAGAFAGRDDMEISVYGNDERIVLTARFDNLGKGASGAAVQNMNLLFGVDEATGLNVG